MPPTDNMPDFDSMSPEELMAWMETLAERQGATEGFTTESRVDIAEIDPTSVQDTGPGYIPYGMTEEQWAKKQEEEAAKKAARQAERAAQAPPPAQIPTPETPPAATPAVASSGDAPDFDSMSPEELMAWMETLAERQGADPSEMTTQTRMQIAEIDPNSVQDTGPGYIPYGMTEEQWAKKQEEEAAKKAARQAERAAQVPPPAPIEVEPEELPQVEEEEPDFELPQLDMEAEMTTQATSTGLDWLEDLAADSGGNFPEMDLSGLGDDLAGGFDLSALNEAEDTQSSDPMAWLDGLAQGDEQPGIDLSFDDEEPEQPSFELDFGDDEAEEEFDLEPAAMGDFGDSDEDPLNWLESLAREQGADPSEFTTNADFAVADDADEDTGFSFDAEGAGFGTGNVDELDAIDMEDEADPVAWLEGLASQQSFTEHDEDEVATPFGDDPLVQTAKSDEVMRALQSGDVSSEDMRGWMDNLLSQGIERSDEQGFKIPEAEDDFDEEDDLQANIPDWLVDQVGPPPEALSTEQTVAFTDATGPEAVQDIPDWLKDSVEETAGEDIAQIFDTNVEEVDVDFEFEVTSEPEEAVASHDKTELSYEEMLSLGDGAIDTDDPWVEAFELERTGATPDFIAEAAQSAVSILEEVTLPPETTLAHGEPMAVPDWISGGVSVVGEPVAPVSSAPAVVSEMEAITMDDADLPDWLREMETQDEIRVVEDEELPDWLREAGVEADVDVPEWLRDTTTNQPAVAPPAPQIAEKQPEPSPQPMQQPAAVVPVSSPAPVMVSMNPEEVAALLETARERVKSGDVETGLEAYESVIRANAQLDHVVNDLSKLVKDGPTKSNPAAHRVLGDGLMRLGRLQEALDTYRKALNLL